MTTVMPAGWYPAPHANNELRYWDGAQWLEPSAVGSGDPATAAYPVPLQPAPPSAGRPASPPSSPSRGLGLAALIVGIAAFLLGLIPWLGLLLALGGIALGIAAMVKKQPKGFTITGIALSGVALIAGLVATASFSAVVASAGNAASSSEQSVTQPSEAEDEPAEEAAPAEEPSTEPEPAPAAPVADGSVTSPFPQPYIATGLLGGEKYSLTARIIDANANALVKSWNQFNSDAPAGFKYVIIELSMTGIDPDGVEPSLAEWDLTLATAEGNQYNSETVVMGEGMPSMWEGPTLYPGSSFTGYAAYVVPEPAQSFLIHDNGNYVAF